MSIFTAVSHTDRAVDLGLFTFRYEDMRAWASLHENKQATYFVDRHQTWKVHDSCSSSLQYRFCRCLDLVFSPPQVPTLSHFGHGVGVQNGSITILAFETSATMEEAGLRLLAAHEELPDYRLIECTKNERSGCIGLGGGTNHNLAF